MGKGWRSAAKTFQPPPGAAGHYTAERGGIAISDPMRDLFQAQPARPIKPDRLGHPQGLGELARGHARDPCQTAGKGARTQPGGLGQFGQRHLTGDMAAQVQLDPLQSRITRHQGRDRQIGQLAGPAVGQQKAAAILGKGIARLGLDQVQHQVDLGKGGPGRHQRPIGAQHLAHLHSDLGEP